MQTLAIILPHIAFDNLPGLIEVPTESGTVEVQYVLTTNPNGSQSSEKSGASEVYGVDCYLPQQLSQSPEKSGASEDYPLEDPSVKVRKGLFGARGSKTVN